MQNKTTRQPKPDDECTNSPFSSFPLPLPSCGNHDSFQDISCCDASSGPAFTAKEFHYVLCKGGMNGGAKTLLFATLFITETPSRKNIYLLS